MQRHFLIDEIMFEGISGEIRGVVSLDRYTGLPEKVDCQTYTFRVDATDEPTLLTESQRRIAEALVERVLESDSELQSSGTYVASAARLAPPQESACVLADYLEKPQRPDQSRPRKVI